MTPQTMYGIPHPQRRVSYGNDALTAGRPAYTPPTMPAQRPTYQPPLSNVRPTGAQFQFGAPMGGGGWSQYGNSMMSQAPYGRTRYATARPDGSFSYHGFTPSYYGAPQYGMPQMNQNVPYSLYQPQYMQRPGWMRPGMPQYGNYMQNSWQPGYNR